MIDKVKKQATGWDQESPWHMFPEYGNNDDKLLGKTTMFLKVV